MSENFNSIEQQIQYSFKNKKLLTEALTHKSFCIEQNAATPNNERLEFLGDSILNFVVAAELYARFPKAHDQGR